MGAVSPGDRQQLSPRSALLAPCVFLSLRPREDFSRQEFAVHIRKLSRNSPLPPAAALWGAGAASRDRAGSREGGNALWALPEHSQPFQGSGGASTGVQLWDSQRAGEGQEPGASQPPALEGREVLGSWWSPGNSMRNRHRALPRSTIKHHRWGREHQTNTAFPSLQVRKICLYTLLCPSLAPLLLQTTRGLKEPLWAHLGALRDP